MFGQSLLSGAFGSALDPGLYFNNKLYNGTGTVHSIGGKIKGNAYFNAATPSKVELGSYPIGNWNDGKSFSCWVNFASFANGYAGLLYSEMFNNYLLGHPIIYYMGPSYNKFRLGYSQTNGSNNFTFWEWSYTVTLGTWYHITYAGDDSTTTLYINGVSQGAGSKTSGSSFGTNGSYTNGVFGDQGEGAGNGWALEGSLDQARMFDSILTQAQVNSLHAETVTTASTLDFPAGAGCVTGYTFDTNADTIVPVPNSTTDITTCDFPTGAGCQALYQLEDNVTDTCGNYNGTANNITYASGIFDNAAVFNGSTSDIDLPAGVDSTTMSVSFWIYIDAVVTGNEVVVELENGYGVWFIASAAGKLGMQSANSNSSHTLSNVQLGAGSWHHIAAVWNSGSRTFYINGAAQSGGTVTDYLTCNENTLGSRRSGEFFNGKLDQVRIFNTALTQSQVAQLARGTQYNGTSSNVTYDGFLNFQPDLVWQKSYSTNGTNHLLTDSVRGAPQAVLSNDSSNQQAWGMSSLDPYGFTTQTNTAMNGDGNVSGQNYITWNWKAGGTAVTNNDGSVASQVSANQDAGFSIVKFTANSTTPTVGHGLTNSIPDLIIVKATSFSDSWFVNSSFLTNRTDKALRFNQDSAEETNSGFWNNIAPTSTTFSLGNGIAVSGSSYIAYCWHSVAKYSKIGSYPGTGTTNNITGLGFEPAWVLIKCTDTTSTNWQIWDAKRTSGYNLFPNLSIAEVDNSSTFTGFTADGFTVAGTSQSANASGSTYLYMAFAAPLT